jgi:hypothetical protein
VHADVQWVVGAHACRECVPWLACERQGTAVSVPQVRDRLVAACQDLGVRFVYNASVEDILPPAAKEQQQQQPQHGDQSQQERRQPPGAPAGQQSQPRSKGTTSSSQQAAGAGPARWRVSLASGATVTADRLVVSTGGYSFPAVGTDGTGLRLLKGLGHKLSDGGCYAALTPLKGPHPGGEQLAGGCDKKMAFVCGACKAGLSNTLLWCRVPNTRFHSMPTCNSPKRKRMHLANAAVLTTATAR